jgi:hypothetical protein
MFSLERLQSLELAPSDLRNHKAGKVTLKDFEKALEELNKGKEVGHLPMYA